MKTRSLTFPWQWFFCLAVLALAHGRISRAAETSPGIRVVDGKIYDLRFSPRWLSVTGEVRRVLTNGVLVQTYVLQNVYGPAGSGNDLQRLGAYGGGNILSATVIGKKPVYGKTLLLKNFPNPPPPGQTLTCPAMWTAHEPLGEGSIEAWDCGRPATPEEIEAARDELEAQARAFAEARAKQKLAREAETKAKVVAFQKEQAAKGLAPYQYELGMRYLKGDGVETNREEALRWLKAAAAQGHEDARKELSRQ